MKRKARSVLISILYVVADAVSILAAFLSAYTIRFSGLFLEVGDSPELTRYLTGILISTPIFLILFRYFKLYSIDRPVRRWDVLGGSVYAVTFGFIICLALTFFYRQENFFYSRLFMFMSWLLILLYFNTFRFFMNKFERKIIKAKGLEKRVVVLGINKTARRLIKWLKEARYSGYRVRGIYSVGEEEQGKHIENCEILGSLKDFENELSQLDIDEVILTDPKYSREDTARLMLLCESHLINFRVIADLYGLVTSSVHIDTLNNIPVLGLKNLPLDDVWNRLMKRSSDLLGSLFGLILTAPLFVILSSLIKAEDGGGNFL